MISLSPGQITVQIYREAELYLMEKTHYFKGVNLFR